MTTSQGGDAPADDVPIADAAEQRQDAHVDAQDAGLDVEHVTDVSQRDANAADVVDQAVVEAFPDDDRSVEPD